MREVSGWSGSVPIVEISQHHVLALAANRGPGPEAFVPRPSSDLIERIGENNTKGGRQNDASRRFPLKRQSSALSRWLSWTRRFAPLVPILLDRRYRGMGPWRSAYIRNI
jgi:hypothetical protein